MDGRSRLIEAFRVEVLGKGLLPNTEGNTGSEGHKHVCPSRKYSQKEGGKPARKTLWV